MTTGQRIAGALLVANAILILLERVLLPKQLDSGPLSSPGGMIVPSILDVIIGVSLLSGNKKFLPWAIVRTVLGLIILTVLQALKAPLVAVLQVAVSSAFLLLLVGDAGRLRIAAGGALFGLYALLEVIGLTTTRVGSNPIAVLVQRLSGDIEQEPVETVTGSASHYRLRLPPGGQWYLRVPERFRKENPLADRWLTRPDVDAHVLVISEKKPNLWIPPEALTDEVISNARKASSEYELLGREPLRTHPRIGRLVHSRLKTNGVEVETLSGVVGVYEHGYQVIAFVPVGSYARLEADLRGIIESFELPTDERPSVPVGAEPTPASRVRGRSADYVLTAPGEGWYVREEAAAKKDNPLVDRWLVRPEGTAQILVIPESAPGMEVDVERYADVMADHIQKNLKGTLESREPLRTHPKTGRLLHARASVKGVTMEYYYGLFARGEHGLQVIALAPQSAFPQLADELKTAITTFELPPAWGAGEE